MRWKKVHRRARRRSSREFVRDKWIREADRWVSWYRRDGCRTWSDGLQCEKPNKYILLDGVPWPCGDWQKDERWMLCWGAWFEAASHVRRLTKKHRYNRQMMETRCRGIRISTVFLGLEHNFGKEGLPILFETMVFGGGEDWDGFQRRYATREEALKGHAEVLEQIDHGLVVEENSEDVDVIYNFLKILDKVFPDPPTEPKDEWPEVII